MAKIKKISLIANLAKKKVPSTLGEIVSSLEQKDRQILLSSEVATRLGRKDLEASEEKIRSESDILLSLGGDGTLLKSAHTLEGTKVPILGINLGGLGFLTEISYKRFREVLPSLLAGKYYIEKRTMLKIKTSVPGKEPFAALNELVISAGESPRIIKLKTSIDGNYLTTFASDGLIIATPTGSTAHSLSAGGPIIHPSLDCLCLVPICPHTISNRPLLIPQKSQIKVRVDSQHPVYYTIDGQTGGKLKQGEEVSVTSAPTQTHLIRIEKRSFYSLLRKKLRWSGYSIAGR